MHHRRADLFAEPLLDSRVATPARHAPNASLSP